jgi:pimeloyl-ACP methyl ester carboxylesterase
MAEIPTTRYVKSDDVHVAYQVIGEGPVDVLWVPGFVSHMEAGWQNPQGAALLRRLSSFCRLILFDKRGTGMSDRGSQIFTLEQPPNSTARSDPISSRIACTSCMRHPPSADGQASSPSSFRSSIARSSFPLPKEDFISTIMIRVPRNAPLSPDVGSVADGIDGG